MTKEQDHRTHAGQRPAADKDLPAGTPVVVDAEGAGPTVTIAKGLEPGPSMVTTKAPELGAPAQQAAPWTTKTPLPGGPPSAAPAPGQRPENTGGPRDAEYAGRSPYPPEAEAKDEHRSAR